MTSYPSFPVREEIKDVDDMSDLGFEDDFDASIFLSANDKQHEEVYMFNEDESPSLGTETSVKISREGLRRNKRSSATANSSRHKKSDHQVKILSDVYRKTKGQLDLKARNEIMAKTGLEWIQIYKWFFDRVNRKSQAKNRCCEEQPTQIFRVIGKDGREIGGPAPLFKIEKIARKLWLTKGEQVSKIAKTQPKQAMQNCQVLNIYHSQKWVNQRYSLSDNDKLTLTSYTHLKSNFTS